MVIFYFCDIAYFRISNIAKKGNFLIFLPLYFLDWGPPRWFFEIWGKGKAFLVFLIFWHYTSSTGALYEDVF